MEAGVLWKEEVQSLKDKEYKKVDLEHMLADNCYAIIKKSKTI